MKIKIIILTLILSIPVRFFAQNTEIDSLKFVADTIGVDSLKIKTLTRIANLYSSENNDSSVKYFNKALELAIDFDYNKIASTICLNHGDMVLYSGQYDIADSLFDLAILFAEKNNFKTGKAEAIYLKGLIYDYKGEYTEANEYYFQALEQTPSKRDSARYYIGIGNVYIRRAYYILALEAYQKSLKMMYEVRYRYGIATCYLNIGNVFLDQKDFKKALSSYIRGLVIYEDFGNVNAMAYCYNNIGTVLDHSGNYKAAYPYYLKTLNSYKQVNNLYGIALSYSNIASYFSNEKMYDSAFYYYQKAETIELQLEDKESLLILYRSLGALYKDKGNFSKAIDYSLKSYQMAQEIESLSRQREALEVLSESYALSKDFKNAYFYNVKFKELHDSIYNEDNQKKLTQQEVKFEYDKKIEIQRIEQKRQQQLHDAEMQRQGIIKKAFLSGLILMFLTLFFVFRAFLIKKKANVLISQKNNEIEQQNVELEQQKEEIMAQTESLENANIEISKQKHALEVSYKHVTDSINYASRIQNAIISDEIIFNTFFKEHFILWEPRDIVSGDFYWVKETENHILIAVADCTGHGVPGAFMSVLGVSLLNEVLRRNDIISAADTLEFLRANVKNALKQSGDINEQKDGMDMAFCAIDKSLKTLQYAGANNPLYISRNNKIIEYKPVRNPIGIYVREKQFENHKIDLHNNDQIYLFSDGYADQLNENIKKFTTFNLKKLLVEVSDKSMKHQKEILYETIIKWKGNFKQLDDILFVGLKV